MDCNKQVVCLFFTSSVPVLEIAEACYRFTPQIAVRDQSAVFLEMSASRNLFKEESLYLRLKALVSRFGYSARIAFAEDASAALAMARFSCTEIKKLPLGALIDYASPFELDEFDFKKISSMISTLHVLGVNNIEDFSKLPIRTLASRFGSLGLHLGTRVRQSLEGSLSFPWPMFRMPKKISEKIEMHDSAELSPCFEMESLSFVIKGLADRMVARLKGRSLRVSTLEIEFEFESSAPKTDQKRKSEISFHLPQGSVVGVLPIIRERLDAEVQRNPFPAAVVSICLTVTESAPGYALQKDFFNKKENEAENRDALVERLCQKLGKDKAFNAIPVDRYLPEKSWTRSLNAAYSNSGGRHSVRPSRMLKRPQLLRKEGDSLVGVSSRDKQWEILEWHGPERISGEWWEDPKVKGFSRDYYRVVTESGEQLWVYLNLDGSDFFLHGYFD